MRGLGREGSVRGSFETRRPARGLWAGGALRREYAFGGGRRGWGGPVGRAGGDDGWSGVAGGLQMEAVEAGTLRIWLEAEQVAVGYVVGEQGDLLLEAAPVHEAGVLAPGECGNLRGGICAHCLEGDEERGGKIEGVEERLVSRAYAVGRVFVSVAGKLVSNPGFLGRKGKAQEGDVAFAESANDLLRGYLAAVILRLAEEQEDAAGSGRLVGKEVNAGVDGVEQRCSVVSGGGFGEGLVERFGVGGERPKIFGSAVEGEDGKAARGGSGERTQKKREMAEEGELARCSAACLHEDNEGEGLALRIGFEREFLQHGVVREPEIGGSQAGDEFSGRSAHGSWDQDEGGGGGEATVLGNNEGRREEECGEEERLHGRPSMTRGSGACW